MRALAAIAVTFSTPAGSPGTVVNSQDGNGAGAQFDAPRGVAVDRAGNIYVADTLNNTIRKISPSGDVVTLAGMPGQGGFANGTGAVARFNEPFGLAVDEAGTLYVADASNNAIRKITSAGVVSTLAGGGGAGSSDGMGPAARLDEPRGIAVNSAGVITVADYGSHTIRAIATNGSTATVAGVVGSPGTTDGSSTAARFHFPSGVALTTAGVIYVADTDNDTIRAIASSGAVTTPAGQAGRTGSADGTGSSARFSVPYAVAVDANGTVFVVDHGNHTIRKITADGVVTTLAGTAGSAGSTDGSGAAARFRYPSGVAVDRNGNVFVADADNHLIRQISPSGEVTTVGGSGSPGSTDGVGTAARFFNPKGIAADGAGRIYVADRSHHTIRVGAP